MTTITHIQHYNRLRKRTVSKKAVHRFQQVLKKDIDAGKITDRMPYGFELIKIERMLKDKIEKMNDNQLYEIDLKPIPIIKPVKHEKPATKNNSKATGAQKPLGNVAVGVPGNQTKKLVTKPELPRKDVRTPVESLTREKGMNSTIPLKSVVTKNTKRKDFSALGFTAADKAPDKVEGLFRLPGEIGVFLGELQRYRGQIVIAGEFSSGKSEVAKIIADAFASIGDNVAYVDWEHGGMKNKDTRASMDRNISPKNKARIHVSDEDFPMTFEALEQIAPKFDMVVIDSGSKIQEQTNAWLDQLRIKHPDTFWIVLMQLKENGNVRGGSSAEFNAPTVIKTWAPDQGQNGWKTNYAETIKNRGNTRGLFYSISKKKIIKPQQP